MIVNLCEKIVGFVFGYKNPSGPVTRTAMNVETYVFDWKQNEQTDNGGLSKEGYALYKVDGVVDYSDYPGSTGPVFWARDNTPISTLLATNFNNNGWNDFQEYTFRLLYTAWNVTIWIDGEEIINIDGCFEPGRFGFYNSSQNYVIYSDFTYQYIADFDVINPDICVNDTGVFKIGFNDCPYSDYYPHGTTFHWDFGDGEEDFGRSQKHKYNINGEYDVILTVTDPLGCEDTSIHNIKVDWLQMGPIDSLSICNGKEIEIDATNNIAISYDWTTNETTPKITVNSAGTYVATIQDATGCIGFDTTIVEIEPNPTVEIIAEQDLCVGDPINLSTTDPTLTYEWSNGSNINSTTVKDPGFYWVKATTKGGCIGEDSVEILSIESPYLELPNDTQLCKSNGPLNITAKTSNNLNLIWHTNETGTSISVDKSQTVKVIGSTPNGCLATDSMVIFFEETPITKLPNDTTLCENEELYITYGDGIVTSKWYGPKHENSGTSITVTSEGEYILENASPLNCVSRDSIYVSFEKVPLVNLPADTALCFNSDTRWHISGGKQTGKYYWSTGDTSQSIEIEQAGTYSLTVETPTGCKASDEYTANSFCPHAIYFPNAFTPNNDGTNDYFPTPNYNLKDYHFRIYNRWGELIFVSDHDNQFWDGTHNNQNCQTDVYVWLAEWDFLREDGKVVTQSKVGRVSLLR